MHNAKRSSSRYEQEHLEVTEPTQQNPDMRQMQDTVVPKTAWYHVAGTGVAFLRDIPLTQISPEIEIISAPETDLACPGVASAWQGILGLLACDRGTW